jgi:glycosyltransferase involved in cell wall biosynthesis
MPKYTIIIPARNSLDYLKDSIESVLSQDFSDYELIVSDNHSADDTYEYVSSIKHPNLKLIKPEKALAMVDHWEWALSHAKGEWLVFLGVDDGVMPYFFKLAEFLTCEAIKRNIRVINSVRAYFFWDGCQTVYGNKSISYSACTKYVIKHSKFELLNATIGTGEYIHLPQMYTTSIVHKSVIRNVKAKNNGNFYDSLNPDANGAASICSLENKYMESLIPLSWVGSSPKSNGLIYATNKDKYRKENSLNLNPNIIRWNPLAGHFNNGINDRIICNFKMYLFESLLQTRHLQKPFWAKTYNSNWFKTMLFAAVYAQIKKRSPGEVVYLKEIDELNKISFGTVRLCSLTISWFVRSILKAGGILYMIKNEIFLKTLRLKRGYMADSKIRLMDACGYIRKLDKEKTLYKASSAGEINLTDSLLAKYGYTSHVFERELLVWQI